MVRQHGLLATGLIALGLGIAGLALLSAGVVGPRARLADAAARGAWIFRTGTTPDGRPLTYRGGMMMRLSCADCHGLDGRGLRTPMFVSPDITYRNLTDPAGMLEPDGTRGPTYTDELIRRAVTQGIDAEGKPLAWPMPRWLLSDAEWQDLLAYLKTLP
ncbi:MAG TPA: c-type cytochrome [Chloroflexota bacterium]|nr:c-type cytochrome [Chloroflexota bacterium]